MSVSYDLFCRWKHVQKIGSDNAGALSLGVTRSTVSLWKQGKNAEIHLVEKMAEEIGDDPMTWAAQVMAERSGSDAEQSTWARFARRLAATAPLLLAGLLGAAHAPAQAAPDGHNSEPTVCIMRNCVLSELACIASPSKSFD